MTGDVIRMKRRGPYAVLDEAASVHGVVDIIVVTRDEEGRVHLHYDAESLVEAAGMLEAVKHYMLTELKLTFDD